MTKRLFRTAGLLALILLASTAIRAAYQHALTETPAYRQAEVDAGYHDAWARGLAFGQWENPRHDIASIPRAPFFRPPGYPYFLAGVYALFGDGYVAPRAVQAGLGLLTLGVFALFCLRWYGAGTGLLAAALCGSYWGLVYFEGELLEVPLLVFCDVLLVLALSASAVSRRGLRGCAWAALAGLALGAHAVTRPNILIFAPAAALWLLWRRLGADGRDGSPDRPPRGLPAVRDVPTPPGHLLKPLLRLCRSAWPSACLTLATLAAVLPCTVRNWRVSGEPVLISANSGINLYIGNHAQAEGLFVGSTQEFGAFGTSSKYGDVMAGVAKKVGHALTYKGTDDYFAKLAGAWIRENPGQALRLVFRKLVYLSSAWETGHNRSLYWERRKQPVIRFLPVDWGFLLALCGAGAVFAAGKKGREGAGLTPPTQVILLLCACYSASFLPFFVTGQYRMPLVPWLCLGAAGTLVSLCSAGRRLWAERGSGVSARPWVRPALAAAVFAGLWALTEVNWLKFEPNLAKWHSDEGFALESQGRAEEAAAQYRLAIDAGGQTGMAWMGLGQIEAARGRQQEALGCYQKALEVRVPEMHKLFSNIGSCLYQLGRAEEALPWFEKALEAESGTPEVHANYGNVLLSLGRVAQAREAFEKALAGARKPMPFVALRAGALAWRAGERQKAEAYFAQAVKWRPDFAEAVEKAKAQKPAE